MLCIFTLFCTCCKFCIFCTFCTFVNFAFSANSANFACFAFLMVFWSFFTTSLSISALQWLSPSSPKCMAGSNKDQQLCPIRKTPTFEMEITFQIWKHVSLPCRQFICCPMFTHVLQTWKGKFIFAWWKWKWKSLPGKSTAQTRRSRIICARKNTQNVNLLWFLI